MTISLRALFRLAAALPLAIGCVAVSAQPATSPAMPALGLLESGLWTLTTQDNAGTARTMCLGDRTALLQVQHGSAPCQRFIVSNEPTSVTVHYSCKGAGSGRTTLRVETPRLVRIDTQGIDRGSPFEFTMEGRRTGMCSGTR